MAVTMRFLSIKWIKYVSTPKVAKFRDSFNIKGLQASSLICRIYWFL